MKRYSFLCLLLLIPVIQLMAQIEIKRTVFIPPEYYIGDPVELRIQIELDDYKSIVLPEKEVYPEWIEIKEILISQNGKEVEIIIYFTSFSPGIRALPKLDFGLFVLDSFKIYTMSLVEQGQNELKGLRPQVLIPGSRLYFALLAAAVLILPYFLYFFFKFLIKNIKIIAGKYHSARPYRSLIRVLKKLDTNLEKTNLRDFFITLSDSLRIYLTARTGFDCKTATTSEISMFHGFGLKGGLWDRLVVVLKKGDMVKFGGEQLSNYEMKENLDFVISICQEIEKREDFHVDI